MSWDKKDIDFVDDFDLELDYNDIKFKTKTADTKTASTVFIRKFESKKIQFCSQIEKYRCMSYIFNFPKWKFNILLLGKWGKGQQCRAREEQIRARVPYLCSLSGGQTSRPLLWWITRRCSILKISTLLKIFRNKLKGIERGKAGSTIRRCFTYGHLRRMSRQLSVSNTELWGAFRPA